MVLGSNPVRSVPCILINAPGPLNDSLILILHSGLVVSVIATCGAKMESGL